MKKTYLFFLLCFCSSTAFTQTKFISHKSHSGSNANFKLAVDKNLFDIGASNFGVAPEPLIQTARLDSIILLSPEAAIMVTTKICTRPYEDTTIWSAGKDTVYNHPLFSQQHSLKEIKKILDQEYHFDNKAKSVTFIGYDDKPVKEDHSKVVKKEIPQKQEKNIKKKKVKKKDKQQSKQEKENQLEENQTPKSKDQIDYTKSSVSFFIIGLVALFSFLVAWFASKFQKP